MADRDLLFYINSIKGGGAERVIIQLARHFAENGYHSILVTSFIDKENEYEVPLNVERLSLEQEQVIQSRVTRNISRILKLRKIIKKREPVAVISFMAEPNFRALIASQGLAVKTIVSVRNDPSREYAGRIGQLVGRKLLPYADGCVFQTEEAKKWFPEKLQRKSRVIINDVKEDFFEINRVPETTHDVVALGRLSEQKNHELLINAFSLIESAFPNQRLLIYGDGPLHDSLQKLIQEKGLGKRVFLMGSTTHVDEVLRNASVFVLSSDYEGMPNCLMEALAAGVPCISTDCPCGGPKMLIEDNVNGLLVPVGDAEQMSRSISQMLSNKDTANIFGKQAKISARRFHPDVIFSEWKDYVEEVIQL